MFHQKRNPSDNLQLLLPWYLNRTLEDAERKQMEHWLAEQPGAIRQLKIWQQVRTATNGQLQAKPSPELRRKIMEEVHALRQPANLPQWTLWLSSIVLTLMVLFMLWNVMQPGIGLQWSISGKQPTSFLIYRAPLNSDEFEVVREIPAQSGRTNYTFVDTALTPGQAYQYRVETATHEAVSATIAASSLEVLPLQIIIILSSLACGLAAADVLRQVDITPSRRRVMI